MRDAIRVRTGRILAAYAVLAGLVGGALYVALGQTSLLLHDWVLHNAAGGMSVGLLVWLLIARQPRNAAVWALVWSAAFQGTNALALGLGQWQLHRLGMPPSIDGMPPADLPTALALTLQVSGWVWLPAVFLLLTLALLLFPDGRPPSPGWRWVGWWSGGAIVWLAAVFFWIARPSSSLPVVGGEVDLDILPRVVSIAIMVGFVALIVGVLLSLAALVARFRASTGVERQQFRWIAWGASFLAVSILLVIPAVVSPEGFGFGPMKIAAAVALPVFIGSYVVAVARYRLYEIDRIISRSASYVLITATLALTYVVSVLGLRAVLSPLTQGSELAVAASTLAVAAAFVPVRNRVQVIVDRRFNRAAYDAQRAVASYAQRLRDEVELDTVRDGLTAVASATVQPSHVGVWLAPAVDGSLDDEGG